MLIMLSLMNLSSISQLDAALLFDTIPYPHCPLGYCITMICLNLTFYYSLLVISRIILNNASN